MERKAAELSIDFLENEKQYRLGFVEAEQSNPLTKTLGETFVKSTKDGIEMLLSVDRALYSPIKNALFSEEFSELYKDVLNALKRGGRIIISGCGSTGRLAMRIEASWRAAISALVKENPELEKYSDSVIEVMTGGDFAVIRSVESFEDYAVLGAMQVREMCVSERDLLIGVTATGETTSILGSAKEALSYGAHVWMVVCTDPESVTARLLRAKEVFCHKNTNSLYIKCGPFAVSGSSRMQSSTSEQLIISFVLELALSELVSRDSYCDAKKEELMHGFSKCLELISEKEAVKSMTEAVDRECDLYSRGGHVTYFADEYLLDVLTDTTERSPTFTTPPFRPQKNKDETLSWAFVKNPRLDTKAAWDACFARTPRCIDKTDGEYIALGVREYDVKRIPKINLDAILEYEIGCERDPEREGAASQATWVDFSLDIPRELEDVLSHYETATTLTVTRGGKFPIATRLKIFEHVAVKLMLNTVSTGTMAKMGRVRGNYMVHLNISNKKLIDRATRIISEIVGISYEEANYELFLSKLLLESQGDDRSTTIATIDRLTNKNG
ncbi:MAG: hypothetical protein IKB38_10855 [Clostridia bacterium]|nr:hypothetical protein [Clostridia bacterium]MBR2467412.1 hypothetical protein [Clostridia bacterium]